MLAQMEGLVKFFGPQNTVGVSQEKAFAVISQTVLWMLKLTQGRPRRAHGLCRPVFTCYLKPGASSRHRWHTCPEIPSSWSCGYVSSRLELQTVCACACRGERGSHVRSRRLQWTAMLKTWHQWHFSKLLVSWGFRAVGLLWTSSMEAFYDFIMFLFYVWILVTVHFNRVGDDCKAFFTWNSSSELKIFPHLPSAWGWVVNDRIFIFGWTIPAKVQCAGYRGSLW